MPTSGRRLYTTSAAGDSGARTATLVERERIDALHRYGVLDTSAGPAFDELTSLAAQLCGTPMALVSLVDTDRQWFTSRQGVDFCQTSRGISFCAHALDSTDLLVVPNALADSRFALNPLVVGESHVRFYAGAPLVTPSGHVLGTLCVLDVVPRELRPEQQDQLRVLSRQVVGLLELRRQTVELAAEVAARSAAESALSESQRLLQGIMGATDSVVYAKDADGRYLLANPAHTRLLGLTAQQVLGRSDYDLFPTLAADAFRRHDLEVMAAGKRSVYTERAPDPDGTDHRYLSTKFPLYDGGGAVYAVAGVSTDVTELAEARRHHAESEQRWKALVEHSPVAVAVIGKDGRFTYANPQAFSLYGAQPGELLGLSAAELVPDDDAGRSAALFGALLDGSPAVLGHRWTLRRLDGRLIPVEVNAAAVTHLGSPAVQVELRDVSAQDAIEAALRDSEQRFRALFSCSPAGAAECLPDGTLLALNPQLCDMLGYTAEELLGRSVSVLLADPGYAGQQRLEMAALAETSQCFVERLYRRKDGTELPVLVGLGAVRDDDGRVQRVLGTVIDDSAARAYTRALRASEQRFRTTFVNDPAGLAVLDAAGSALQVNPALCQLLGRSEVELMQYADMTHLAVEADRQGFAELLRQAALKPGSAFSDEKRLEHADGSELWARLRVTELPDQEQRQCLLQVEDVTERRIAEQRLTRQALYDGLTDLPNRAMLLDRTHGALARLSRRPAEGLLAMLYLDLDGFKAVNDTHGHPAGDALLVEISRRLVLVMRPTDTVARLGGDEFAVLCETLPDHAETLRIAGRLAQAVRPPVVWHGHPLTVTASIGIAYGSAALHAQDLIRRADTAMYQAKNAGKDRSAVFDERVQG